MVLTIPDQHTHKKNNKRRRIYANAALSFGTVPNRRYTNWRSAQPAKCRIKPCTVVQKKQGASRVRGAPGPVRRGQTTTKRGRARYNTHPRRSTPGPQRAATHAAPPSTTTSHEYTTNPVPLPYRTMRYKPQSCSSRTNNSYACPSFWFTSAITPSAQHPSAAKFENFAAPTGTWRLM